ncbi:MAG: hypothetical protein KUL83_02405 [Lentimicrobium sp.]|nr:hypothetical protein [Lentimicrobium sp.]
MKKIILITSLFLVTLSGFSQSVTVTVQDLFGSCFYTQQETRYVFHVMIMKDFQIVSSGYTITANTSSSTATVNLSTFQCSDSQGQTYQVLVEVVKIISGTETIICREKWTYPTLFYCSQIMSGISITVEN